MGQGGLLQHWLAEAPDTAHMAAKAELASPRHIPMHLCLLSPILLCVLQWRRSVTLGDTVRLLADVRSVVDIPEKLQRLEEAKVSSLQALCPLPAALGHLFGADRGLSALQGLSCHCPLTTRPLPIEYYPRLAVAGLWSFQLLLYWHTKAASSASECLPCRSGVRQ